MELEHYALSFRVSFPTLQVSCAEQMNLKALLPQSPPAQLHSGIWGEKMKKKERSGKKPKVSQEPWGALCACRKTGGRGKGGGCPCSSCLLSNTTLCAMQGSQGQEGEQRNMLRPEEELHHVDRDPNCSGHSKPRRMTTHQAMAQHLPFCDSTLQSSLQCSHRHPSAGHWIQNPAVSGTGSHWLQSKTTTKSCSAPVLWLFPLQHMNTTLCQPAWADWDVR